MTINFTLDTLSLAAREFVNHMQGGRVFAFYADLGGGKTTFISALCAELGVVDTVQSPTFNIVNQYTIAATGGSIFHFDFYRIHSITEAFDIGFHDYLDSGELVLIEWPELIEPLLPPDTIRCQIAENPDGSRTLSIVEP